MRIFLEKLGKFPKSGENFSQILKFSEKGGNVKEVGNASLALGGWTPLNIMVALRD